MPRARSFSMPLALAAAIATLACSDSNPSAPPDREIEVTVATDNVGGDMDPDGYTLTFDHRSDQNVSDNAIVRFAVSSGRHWVQLTGMAANCRIEGDSLRSVDVIAGEPHTVMILFTIHCGGTPTPGPWDY